MNKENTDGLKPLTLTKLPTLSCDEKYYFTRRKGENRTAQTSLRFIVIETHALNSSSQDC